MEKRRGLPVILSVIYESVGRRVGLIYEPANIPAHFLLKFYAGPPPYTRRNIFYVDAFRRGQLLSNIENGWDRMPRATCQQVFFVIECL